MSLYPFVQTVPAYADPRRDVGTVKRNDWYNY